MDKLIELLNEYEKEREEKIDLFNDKEKPLWEWYKDCTGGLTFEPTDNKKMNGECFSGDTAHSVIISKSYGFIQRLVKQFMFNMTKIDARIALSNFNATDRMLMALAISDNPIELLIDCLE